MCEHTGKIGDSRSSINRVAQSGQLLEHLFVIPGKGTFSKLGPISECQARDRETNLIPSRSWVDHCDPRLANRELATVWKTYD